jgi:hypothetical protein
LQVKPVAFTGVIVQEVVKFSNEFCTPASFKLPKAHAANYTGALSTSRRMPHACTAAVWWQSCSRRVPVFRHGSTAVTPVSQ